MHKNFKHISNTFRTKSSRNKPINITSQVDTFISCPPTGTLTDEKNCIVKTNSYNVYAYNVKTQYGTDRIAESFAISLLFDYFKSIHNINC